ncbi:MAG TPA: hypothetical protein V6D18_09395 [Thermosynechococcaceae cyanobacterium]
MVNGADREPGQITAAVSPNRLSVSARTDAQTVLVLLKSIVMPDQPMKVLAFGSYAGGRRDRAIVEVDRGQAPRASR